MDKKVLLEVLSTIFLFSCATSANYDNKLQKWVGKSAVSLQEKWGRPAHVKMFANGDSIVTYIKANDVYVPSEYIIFNQGYVPGNEVTVHPYPSQSSNFMNTTELVGYETEYTSRRRFLSKTASLRGGDGAAITALHINEKQTKTSRPRVGLFFV
ncbi:MAG: hypothetical protein SO314_07760 [Alphaproteobacteria bacterium]|nr:hypothetical protein [Alphaproteobacteria bacterium]